MVTNAIVQQAAKSWFAWARDASSEQARTRQALYVDLDGYYYNSLWSEQTKYLLRFMSGWAEDATVQGLYNPVKTIVDFYRTHTLRGTLGLAGPDGQPLPPATATIRAANPRLIGPVLDVWQWSNLQATKRLIGRFAANLGDALLVVVDDARPDAPEQAKVWIEVRSPAELVDYEFDSRGNFTLARLAETRSERDAAGRRRSYRYERLLTKDEYATFRDGQPHAYDERGAVWPNPHGFVPVRKVMHEDDGDEFGLNAWHDAVPAIDELNLRATHIGDIIGQHFAAVWLISGASPPAGLNAQGLEEEQELDRGKALYVPKDADAKPLVAPLDFANAYTHIDRLLTWLKEKYPELTLPELRRKSGDLSGVAVRGMLFDLIVKAESIQNDSYSPELWRALQMALTMGSNVGGSGRNLWRERGHGEVGRYEAGDFDGQLVWQEIIPLAPTEALALEAQREALRDEIDQRRAMRATGQEGREGVEEREEREPELVDLRRERARQNGRAQ